MNQDSVVIELKQALLARAQKLAEEYEAKAKRAYEHILEDAHERLHIREQNEILSAQAAADRYYRRQIQANELHFKAQLDQLRWELIQAVIRDLPAKLQAMTEDQNHYRQLLQSFISRSAAAIESDELVIECNADDLAWLQSEWNDFRAGIDSDKQIQLHDRPYPCSGGVLVRSADHRIRIDQSFEGRIERLQEQLWLSIVEQLFQGDRA